MLLLGGNVDADAENGAAFRLDGSCTWRLRLCLVWARLSSGVGWFRIAAPRGVAGVSPVPGCLPPPLERNCGPGVSNQRELSLAYSSNIQDAAHWGVVHTLC